MEPASPLREPAAFWARAVPLGDRRRLLGLGFIAAVAVIWVAASFVVQGIEEHGAHPAVLTLIANSLFAIYLPVYWLNLRWRRRRAAAAAAARGAHQHETATLVPAAAPRSDDAGDTAPALAAAEDSYNGKAAGEAPPMALRQLFRAALIVRAGLVGVGLAV